TEGGVQGRSGAPLPRDGTAQGARWRLPVDLGRLHEAGRLAWAASPLVRAVATARSLGGTAPDLDPRLVERDFGTWQGLTAIEVEARGPDDGWDWRPPGGETLREVLARVRAWLDDVAAAEGPTPGWS